MKKWISMLLVLAMFVYLPLPVVADETSELITVEEILSEYHQKVFLETMYVDSDAVSTWTAGSNTEKTLEQETVDALNEAGYEAYHVTADNFDALETELQTNFEQMGLDPNGAYIVVVHGDNIEDSGSENGQSTFSISPDIDFEYSPGGGLPSTCTYNGVTYSVRFITVSYANDADLRCQNQYRIRQLGYYNEAWAELAEYVFTAAYDYLSESSVASVGALIDDMMTDSNNIPLDPGELQVYATTSWTRQFIEVYNEQGNYWSVSQCSEYAAVSGHLIGLKLDESSGYQYLINGDSFHVTIYSPYYFDMNVRLSDAVNVFLHSNIISHDNLDVRFYLDNGTPTIDSGSKYLFTHYSPDI